MVMPAAWTAAEIAWYADIIAHCQGRSRESAAVSTVLELDEKPLDECLLMLGDAALDGRLEDSASQLWSHDRYGRWFAKVDGKMVWLQAKLGELRYRRAPRRAQNFADKDRGFAEVVSHICGNCSCIRLQHIRYQSKSEDCRDRAHHRAHGGGLRAGTRALLTANPPDSSADSADSPKREISPRSATLARKVRARTNYTEP